MNMKRMLFLGCLFLCMSAAAQSQVVSLSLSVTAKVQFSADSTGNVVVKEVVIDPQSTAIEPARQEAETVPDPVWEEVTPASDPVVRAEAAPASYPAASKDLYARERMIWENRSKYANFGYVLQSLTGVWDDQPDLEPLMSLQGFSLGLGKTWYLHKRPIANVVKFGLDWTWLDLNYARYEAAGQSQIGSGQVDAGMQIGPSITLNPAGRLKISAYGRVSPTYSAVWTNNWLAHHYVTYYNCGATLAWRAISFGLEFRQGGATYNSLDIEKPQDETDNTDPDPSLTRMSRPSLTANGERNLTTRSFRLYFGLRF